MVGIFTNKQLNTSLETLITSLDQVDQSLKTVVDDRRLLSDTGFVKDNRSRHSDEMKPKISCSHKNLLRV